MGQPRSPVDRALRARSVSVTLCWLIKGYLHSQKKKLLEVNIMH
jgi:hypothetical protein